MTINLGRALRAAAGKAVPFFGRPAQAESPQAQISADFDKDGTLDTGLAATWIPDDSIRDATWFDVEVWRSPTIGTTGSIVGYSLWKEFTTKKPNRDFKANARFFHKLRVRQLGFNGVPGAWSAYTAIGIQPMGASGSTAPTGVVVSNTRLGLVVSYNASTDLDYDFSEIVFSTVSNFSSITFTHASRSTQNIIYFPDLTGYYVGVRHVNKSGNRSAVTPSTPNIIYTPTLISSPFITPGGVTTVSLDADAVTRGKLAAGAAGAAAWAQGGTTGTVSVNVGSQTSTQLTGYFRATAAGSPTITLGGNSFPTVTVVNNQPCTFTAVVTGGGNQTFSVSGVTSANITISAIGIN